MFLVRLLICFFFFSSLLHAATKTGNLEDNQQPFNLFETTLKNGMKVCLKPTDYEKDEVIFQIFAMGGYAALAPADRPSAILAPNIAWESGLNDQTADTLAFDLYQNSIELEAKIQIFDRQIEVSSPTSYLESSLEIINLFFTQPKFEQSALKKVINEMRNQIKAKAAYREPDAAELFLKVHTHNWDVFDSLTVPDLDYVNLYKAEKFFKQYFSNPADFTCVMVGDFNPKTVLPLLEKYLGTIPDQKTSVAKNPTLPSFPSGITKQDKSGFQRYSKSLTRLTFPILVKINGTDSINLICHVIKNRLNAALLQNSDSKKKLEVSYEFPFFPRLDTAWLTVQFSSSANEIDTICNFVLDNLKRLQEEGITQQELLDLQASFQAEEMAIEENTFVLSLLSNYYRANWDLKNLTHKKDSVSLEKEVIKNHLRDYFKLNQYSIISLHP